jgi:hypothetical protein
MVIGAVGSLLATAPVLFSPLRSMRTLPDEVLEDNGLDAGVPDDGPTGGRG